MMNVTGTLTEKYILMKGSQCATTTIDVTLEAVGVTQTWIPSEITTPATTAGIGTPVYAQRYDCNALDGDQRRRQLTNL